MTSVTKYRKMSIIAMIIMAVTWLLALAALWNIMLISDIKKEGLLIIFMLLALATGVFLFVIAYKNTDSRTIEKLQNEAFESGKSQILQEITKSDTISNEQKSAAVNIDEIVKSVLEGVLSTRNESTLSNKLLSNLAKEIDVVQGLMYVKNRKDNLFIPTGEYAITGRKPAAFREGETIPGQVVTNQTTMILYDIPENYFIVTSGLGKSQPRFLMIVPLIFDNETIAVLELATFKKPDESITRILDMVLSEVGPKLNKFITA